MTSTARVDRASVTIRLYNTLGRRLETFEPADPARVTVYVCGPTVYNYAHIGNARPPVVFDTLRRLLKAVYGPQAVVFARNITDVDDRIIAAVMAEDAPIEDVTAPFVAAYRSDTAALGVEPPTHEPFATAYIEEMVALIRTLEARGHAYEGPSGVWFCVPSMATYGRLSQRAREDLLAGARVEVEPEKRDPADFALWKRARPDEPAWDSPWGKGRPGWHIECSAMAKAVLGDTIDIHGGGIDLIFPHHENEIAQSECANDRPLARYWMHNGFLDMDGDKMSKSLGNVVLIHELLEQWPGEVLRMAVLSAHYRAPLDWTRALLIQSRATLDGWYRALARLGDVAPTPGRPAPSQVVQALADDLATPRAFAAISALASAAHKATGDAERADLKADLLNAGQLVGLLGQDPATWLKGDADALDTARIEALIAERAHARAARDWARADAVRDELHAMGVELEDGPAGTSWRVAHSDA